MLTSGKDHESLGLGLEIFFVKGIESLSQTMTLDISNSEVC